MSRSSSWRWGPMAAEIHMLMQLLGNLCSYVMPQQRRSFWMSRHGMYGGRAQRWRKMQIFWNFCNSASRRRSGRPNDASRDGAICGAIVFFIAWFPSFHNHAWLRHFLLRGSFCNTSLPFIYLPICISPKLQNMYSNQTISNFCLAGFQI